MAGTDGGFGKYLDVAARADLHAVGRVRAYPRGQVLFYEQDEGYDVMLVLEGHVKVSMSAATGDEVILNVADPGTLLGELSAIDGDPRSATASALTDLEVLIVPVAEFHDFLTRHPEAAIGLLRAVAMRLRYSSQRQLEFGTSDALARLSGAVVEMAERYGTLTGSTPEVTLPLAQHELASLTGMSREAVVKGLQSLRALGWIEQVGRKVTILDVDALRARSAMV